MTVTEVAMAAVEAVVVEAVPHQEVA